MSSVSVRRERQRVEVRSAILEAAGALLVDEGPERFSMRKLAERSGYTVPTLYHHFGDKPGLIRAVLDQTFEHLASELEAVPRGDDPLRYARELTRAFVDFALEWPTHYRLMMMPPLAGEPEPPASAERAREFMLSGLTEMAAAGRLRVDAPEHAGQLMWILCHGLISLTTSRPDYEWQDGLFDAALDALLHGMVRPEAEVRS